MLFIWVGLLIAVLLCQFSWHPPVPQEQILGQGLPGGVLSTLKFWEAMKAVAQ